MKIEITKRFKRQAKRLSKKYPSFEDDYARLLDELDANPTLGQPLGRDCYKIRLHITSKKRGKSGGGRVITCVKIVRDKVYLLTIFDKSEQADISENELDELLCAAGIGEN